MGCYAIVDADERNVTAADDVATGDNDRGGDGEGAPLTRRMMTTTMTRAAAVAAMTMTGGSRNTSATATASPRGGRERRRRGGGKVGVRRDLGCAFRRNSGGFRQNSDKRHWPERNGPGTGTGMCNNTNLDILVDSGWYLSTRFLQVENAHNYSK